jgi:hypothetical protein
MLHDSFLHERNDFKTLVETVADSEKINDPALVIEDENIRKNFENGIFKDGSALLSWTNSLRHSPALPIQILMILLTFSNNQAFLSLQCMKTWVPVV